MKNYKLAVLIGRFQPMHKAHLELVVKALAEAENVAIVLGSNNSPRTIKNPFSTNERIKMIKDSITNIDPSLYPRIHFIPVEDSIYSDSQWVYSVEKEIDILAKDLHIAAKKSVGIICANKDESTYYLNYFKSYSQIDVEIATTSKYGGKPLSATKIRELLFEGYLDVLKSICPSAVINFLEKFSQSEHFAHLKEEYDQAVMYDSQYENVPYGQTNFVTVDSMVVQSGHVLLVQRKDSPGKGLWALPGGHLNINETFIQGAIRELKEETNIKVPEKVLLGSVVYDNVFDHPDRSLRGRIKKKIGRTITRLFVFKLDDSADLPKVKASDDAAKAWWFTFNDIKQMRHLLFEDHFDMIIHGLGRL